MAERAYLDPPVMRTLRPFREYGIFDSCSGRLDGLNGLLSLRIWCLRSSNPTYM